MAIADILASIDHDLMKLHQARALLSGDVAPVAKKKVGRPRKIVAAPKKAAIVVPAAAKPAKKKRNLSPEGRKRIADAVKKRWAAQKKAGSEAPK
jgi:hypothetical protein